MRMFDFEFSPANHAERVAIDFLARDGNIPLHVSLRPNDNSIVSNTLSLGQWGQEAAVEFVFEPTRSYVISIALDGLTAQILVDRKLLQKCNPASQIEDVARPKTVLKEFSNNIDVGGERFLFPFMDTNDHKYIKKDIIPFLVSDVISNTSGVVVDVSNTKAAVGVIFQVIFPNCLVVVGSDGLELEQDLRHCRQNDCASVKILNTADLIWALETAAKGEETRATVAAPAPEEAYLNAIDTAEFPRAAEPDENGPAATPDPPPRSVAARELAQQIRRRGIAAIIGHEIYSPANALLRAALTPHLEASSAAVCSLETDLTATLADPSLRKVRRQVRVSFADSSWTLRRNRFGDIWNREDRLDIGVAMYNTGEFIIPCLESLLAESRDDIRVILVNDGSTDNSLRLVEEKFGGHPRLEIHTKRNGGCASARNYARIVSKAAYIAFVDADDFVDPTMFSSLLDLARVSGNEIVQGGFRFYHSDSGVEQPSYELELFQHWKRLAFKDLSCFRIHADALIRGQPTIWRRVYRRDFLDAKALWFPEHIRAFDDMVFHLMSIYLARDVLHVDDLNYHYRQHPHQDIKQADERHFYELETYRLIAKRAVREGWNDMEMFVPCIENTINFSLKLLRDDLVAPFLEASAELWVLLERTFGPGVFRKEFVHNVRHADYASLVAEKRARIQGSQLGFGAAYMDAAFMHPNVVTMARRLKNPS